MKISENIKIHLELHFFDIKYQKKDIEYQKRLSFYKILTLLNGILMPSRSNLYDLLFCGNSKNNELYLHQSSWYAVTNK
jgi:hypothetical protein